MKFKTNHKNKNLSQDDKQKIEYQNERFLSLLNKVKPYEFEEVKKHNLEIDRKAQERYDRLPTKEVNCVMKRKQVGERHEGLIGTWIGSLFGSFYNQSDYAIGMVAGGALGYLAGSYFKKPIFE